MNKPTNVIQMKPPAPPSGPRRRMREHHRHVRRALSEHQSRVRESTAILALLAEKIRNTALQDVTEQAWNAVHDIVESAVRSLRQVDDLEDAEELARAGADLARKSDWSQI